MLMRPNKAETAVHGCHCPGDMAVCMRKVLARPWVGVRVCHFLLLSFFFLKSVNVNLKCAFINHDINYSSRKLKYKQTFAIVCSFTVSVNKLRQTDSSISPDWYPLKNKVDSTVTVFYIICPWLVQAHSYGSFPPISNNIWQDKDWAICRDWNYESTNAIKT